MRFSLSLLSLAATALLAASAANAAPITYTVTGTLTNGSTINGTFDFDSVGADEESYPASFSYSLTSGSTTTKYKEDSVGFLATNATAFYQFGSGRYNPGRIFLTFSNPNLVTALSTGHLCTLADSCGVDTSISTASSLFDYNGGRGTPIYFASGSVAATPPPVSAAAVTPEPSALALLGTGALGVLGVARRRFLKA